MVYLNHAGTSWPKPAPVRAAVADALQASHTTWATGFEAAHRRVADAFGIRDADRLLLTPGCTSALAVALADVPWEAGDRIVTSSLEHHALHRPAVQLEARGVALTEIPRAGAEPLDVDRLRDELQRGSVRLVAMTAACNVTGELLPMAQIVELAHEHGALCLIDGAQLVGWSDVDVAALGVDLFAFATHKALQAPWGLGGLYVSPGVSLASPAAACALPAVGEPVAGPRACAPMPGYCDAGSVDRAALAGLVAALDWLAAPARAERLERARDRVERLAAALSDLPGARLHGARASEARLPTVAFTLDERPSPEVAAVLAGSGLTVGSGLQCAPRAHTALGTLPHGVVRLSVGPGTSDDDIDVAVAALLALGGR